MTYDQLSMRCRRILNLYPDGTETPLDCMKFLPNISGIGRAIAAEMLARELAEYVAQLPQGGPP